jgi:hypothetical protein
MCLKLYYSQFPMMLEHIVSRLTKFQTSPNVLIVMPNYNYPASLAKVLHRVEQFCIHIPGLESPAPVQIKLRLLCYFLTIYYLNASTGFKHTLIRNLGSFLMCARM